MMRLPLNQWRIYTKDLPERLIKKEESFSLPGVDALSAFSDLIGESEIAVSDGQERGADYVLDGLFEEDIAGAVVLKKEIDFGALMDDRAVLTFEHIAGKGEILLGGKVIARFDDQKIDEDALEKNFNETGVPCRLCVDVTDALQLGKKETLELRFDDARPAGVCGAVFLNTSKGMHLSRVSIQMDARCSVTTIRARACAHRAGRYVLRAQAMPSIAGESLPPAREIEIALDQGEEKTVVLSMESTGERFIPGKAYDAPALKIQVFEARSKDKRSAIPCDETLLLCGCGADAPKFFLPLGREACMGDARALCSRLKEMNIPAVLFISPAPDGLYRALCREGIAAVQYAKEALRPAFTRYPCLTLLDQPYKEENLSLEAAAWQMTGSISFPRAMGDSLTDEEMLFEASGRKLDRTDEGVRASLAWLRVVQIRLRAEAARQGRYQGALCSADEVENTEIQDALKAALAPTHLSALPLSGAWWTGTRFSASLEAFIAQSQSDDLRALAVLEDEEGKTLARFEAPCSKSGYVSVIETQLPEKACVLSLICQLIRHEEIIEESSLPVYVGEMGPLEAAF